MALESMRLDIRVEHALDGRAVERQCDLVVGGQPEQLLDVGVREIDGQPADVLAAAVVAELEPELCRVLVLERLEHAASHDRGERLVECLGRHERRACLHNCM